jgi:hypothetical protein
MNEEHIQAIIANYKSAVAALNINPSGWGERVDYRDAKKVLDTLPRELRRKVTSNMRKEREEKNLVRK